MRIKDLNESQRKELLKPIFEAITKWVDSTREINGRSDTLTKRELEQIAEKYSEESYLEITCVDFFREVNRLRPPGKEVEFNQDILKLKRQGFTQNAIAMKLHSDKRTIQRRLEKMGEVKKRKS